MKTNRSNPEKLWRDLRSLRLRRYLLDEAIESLEAVQRMRQARLAEVPEPAWVGPKLVFARVVRRTGAAPKPMARRLSRVLNFRQHL